MLTIYIHNIDGKPTSTYKYVVMVNAEKIAGGMAAVRGKKEAKRRQSEKEKKARERKRKGIKERERKPWES